MVKKMLQVVDEIISGIPKDDDENRNIRKDGGAEH